MALDIDSALFTASIIFAGIFYGQYMYKKGLETGANRTIEGLYDAGIINVDDDGEISAKH